MTITPESIQQQLSSEDLGDRLRAVNQIRELDQSTGFELIQTAIRDRDTRVRYAAVSQLTSLGVQDRDRSLEILRDCLLNDPEPDVQAAAADALGALKLTQAFDDLSQVYHRTSEWLVQLSIIAALGELGDPRGFELLEDALNNGNELIQTIAVGALGELGDRRAIALLIPRASDPDWQIRHRVAQALGRLGGDEAEAVLEQLARDDVSQVAQQAQVPQESD
ncbi:phycobilisome degradation protein NblB [Lyngbya sp. CCY1209]|uniref:phycobilisome degradation protein NblB n=1 Tax=Lyngbya sp. CCY1209 TaxID=2886103 RepID=UPI002D20365F|nr:HEAT repeat domain-containing protein [Lyngbya sp. CCY1209]MEB3883737.1 HEAT repeat domain-containing protein [Lyngbya sp. CCY1209]